MNKYKTFKGMNITQRVYIFIAPYNECDVSRETETLYPCGMNM